MNRSRHEKFVHSLQRYLSFFLLMAFIVTCCMLLFLQNMKSSMGILFTEEGIQRAAILTFANILLLSLLCTAIDGIRRRIMVEKPIQQITASAEKVMKGDFSVRIQPSRDRLSSFNDFNEIIYYFNRMTEELAGVETLRTDFISNVSHELKTPLAVIQNYGTLLGRADLPEENRREYARAITDTCQKLSSMMTNILKLSKLENQQIYPDKTRYNLGEQLCACLLTFENAWEQKEIAIDTDIEEEVFVESDAELLSLVWSNLFSNAIKFTDPGGRVSVTLRTADDWAIVQICDTGCGINPKIGKHIFEKFYQGDTSHAMEGNGLGLALTKRVLDIVEGDISVESEVGVGSKFIVKIRM